MITSIQLFSQFDKLCDTYVMKNQAFLANLPISRLEDHNLFKSKAKKNAHGQFEVNEQTSNKKTRSHQSAAQVVGDTDESETDELKLEPESEEEERQSEKENNNRQSPAKRKQEQPIVEQKKNGKKAKK